MLAPILWTLLGLTNSIYDISVTTIDNETVSLKKYEGKVLLIVNTASKCGFTPQYEDLEKVYERFKDRGFVVLGFPSNDFGAQEPGSAEEIKKFCKANYGVSFPLFKKNPVTGDDIQPLYKYLTTQTSNEVNGSIKWNFTKFLVNRKGEVVDRYSPMTPPSRKTVTDSIEKLLDAK